ncbi:MAG: HAD-IA family hydrolase [Marinagarivorans sp.]|nr:HAD-IA family hydrolase [Marinagarivorans sp.]
MLVIFDWDGTLSDSTAKIVRCVQRAAAELQLPALADDTVKDIIGLSLSVALQRLYPLLSVADVECLSAAYSRHYLEDEHIPAFYDGALETLSQLKDAGFLLAVATGKSRKGLDRVLAQLNAAHWFVATRCADETASKPDPLMLNELLVECQRHHAQAVMIGDTEFDLAMAQTIAMPRIGVTYGAHSVERLERFAPVMCVSDLRDMVPWLIEMRG